MNRSAPDDPAGRLQRDEAQRSPPLPAGVGERGDANAGPDAAAKAEAGQAARPPGADTFVATGAASARALSRRAPTLGAGVALRATPDPASTALAGAARSSLAARVAAPPSDSKPTHE